MYAWYDLNLDFELSNISHSHLGCKLYTDYKEKQLEMISLLRKELFFLQKLFTSVHTLLTGLLCEFSGTMLFPLMRLSHNGLQDLKH